MAAGGPWWVTDVLRVHDCVHSSKAGRAAASRWEDAVHARSHKSGVLRQHP